MKEKKKTDSLKITILQLNLLWEDRKANLERINTLLEKQQKTDLIVLPEMFTTGFSMNSDSLAEPENGETLAWMVKVSKQKDAMLIGSLIVKEKENFYNRLYCVFPSGETQYYDKRHLFRMGGEHENFAQGNKRLIVSYKGWEICPLVCYDLRFPVWSRNRGDYDILLYIANWPSSRRKVYKSLLTARAIENQAYVVGVNRVGNDGMGLSYTGDSRIIDPKGQKILACHKNREEILTATISYDELDSFRQHFPVAMDADKFEVQL